MIETARYDDVASHRLSWWRSRTIGYGVHVYEVRGVLIDTGFPAVARDVRTLVEAGAIRGAMVTHQHEDHAGNAELLTSLGVPLALAESTRRAISSPHPIGFYRHYTWRAMPPLRSHIEPFHDASLELLPTPGHSVDHHVVWDHDSATLFAGDLFLGVKVRIAHPYEDPRAAVRSLRAMIARTPRRMFCGHRGLVPDPVGALTAKADWTDALIASIERLHREGAGEAEIRRRALGSRGRVHWISRGDYSPDNVVRAVLRERAANA